MKTSSVLNTRIYLESFDKKLLNLTSQKLKNLFADRNETLVGPIGLPMKKRIYCVLRSPHVDKDSREHLEIRRYKCIFDMYEISTAALLDFDIPAGVFVSFSCP